MASIFIPYLLDACVTLSSFKKDNVTLHNVHDSAVNIEVHPEVLDLIDWGVKDTHAHIQQRHVTPV
jgi:hypothetical protein